MSSSRAALAAAASLALGATSCVPPAVVPMRSIERRATSAQVRTLIVFLPGRGSRADTFEKEDFVTVASNRGLAADLLFADATEGYYADRSIVERLHDDIIGPTRARGYERVWLVGTSLGGLGAVLYAKAHPEDIDGLLLLAPYLGDDSIIGAIEASGGLARWPGPYTGDGWTGFTRSVWSWLREAAATQPGYAAIWLGYGRSDRLLRSHALLAGALPPGRVLTAEGGHTWPVWRDLWSDFLDSGAVNASPAE